MVALTGLQGFFIGVWSITLLVEHLLMLVLFLEVAWSDTLDFCFRWLLIRCPLCTTWGSGMSVSPSALLVASILFTDPHPFNPSAWGAAFIRHIFLVPSRVPIHCLLPLRRFQPRFLGGTLAWRASGVPYYWRTAWTDQGDCRTHQALFIRRRDFLLLSDQICRLEVLLSSHPSSLWLAAVSGPVVSLHRRRRRGKVLVLVMIL